MSINKSVRREISMFPVIRAGYSRKMASIWYKKRSRDKKEYKDIFDKNLIKEIHNKGFLCKTVEQYGLEIDELDNYISNFDYLYLEPFNNSFSKWLQDIITSNRILKNHSNFMRKVFYSIIKRNGEYLILSKDDETREYTIKDILKTLEKNTKLELRPSFWLSKRKRYKLELKNENLYVNGELSNLTELESIILNLGDSNYIISEYIDIKCELEGDLKGYNHYLKFWIANDVNGNSEILDGNIIIYFDNEDNMEDENQFVVNSINLDDGLVLFDNKEIYISDWQKIKTELINIAKTLNKLTYFTISIVLKENHSFKIVSMSSNPTLPKKSISDKLNNYLQKKVNMKNANRKYTLMDHFKAIRKSRFYKYTKKNAKPGMRPYMYAIWLKSIWDDLWNTKVSLGKKIWAWKRGFLSFRIEQYGLNDNNYMEYLSDYNYHWLNRINNAYQIWVNDKTTFRYILDPYKEYIPKYYFSIFNRNGVTEIQKMQDCEEQYTGNYTGILDCLNDSKILALKPSAGTHGDGFYCLTSENGQITVNGEYKSKKEFIELLESFKSFYLVTEYIEMNDELKKIYPKSVNSIRVMVINESGYNPKIMQAYMRIGSSRTGYTDNVGYGGICVMIDIDTGEMYNPETIVDHKFYPCPKHPDTGTLIEGKIPYWEDICKKIREICRYLSELEYLGFDIAVTNDGFQVIEINIHQDLHKVATLDKEVMKFYEKKIELKSKSR